MEAKVLQSWITAILEEGHEVTEWETEFAESVQDQLNRRGSLSVRQEEVLEKIYAREEQNKLNIAITEEIQLKLELQERPLNKNLRRIVEVGFDVKDPDEFIRLMLIISATKIPYYIEPFGKFNSLEDLECQCEGK